MSIKNPELEVLGNIGPVSREDHRKISPSDQSLTISDDELTRAGIPKYKLGGAYGELTRGTQNEK